MYFLFIPRHRIDRHSAHFHARVVILKTQDGYMRDVTNQCCDVSNRAVNDRRAINDLYGTIASHDDVWQFH